MRVIYLDKEITIMVEIVKKFESLETVDEKVAFFNSCNEDELEALIVSGVYEEIINCI